MAEQEREKAAPATPTPPEPKQPPLSKYEASKAAYIQRVQAESQRQQPGQSPAPAFEVAGKPQGPDVSADFAEAAAPTISPAPPAAPPPVSNYGAKKAAYLRGVEAEAEQSQESESGPTPEPERSLE